MDSNTARIQNTRSYFAKTKIQNKQSVKVIARVDDNRKVIEERSKENDMSNRKVNTKAIEPSYPSFFSLNSPILNDNIDKKHQRVDKNQSLTFKEKEKLSYCGDNESLKVRHDQCLTRVSKVVHTCVKILDTEKRTECNRITYNFY